MTEQETRRIAREEIARALEAMQGDCFDRSSANRLHPPAEAVEVVGKTIDAALAALREPEPIRAGPAEAVTAFAAWLTTRREAVTASAAHDSSAWARLCAEFSKANGWEHADERAAGIVFPSELPDIPNQPNPLHPAYTVWSDMHDRAVRWRDEALKQKARADEAEGRLDFMASAIAERIGSRGREIAEEALTRLLANLDGAEKRCRSMAQAIIERIGSNGPENAEEAVARLLAKLDEAEKRGREKMRAEALAECELRGWDHVVKIVRRLP